MWKAQLSITGQKKTSTLFSIGALISKMFHLLKKRNLKVFQDVY